MKEMVVGLEGLLGNRVITVLRLVSHKVVCAHLLGWWRQRHMEGVGENNKCGGRDHIADVQTSCSCSSRRYWYCPPEGHMKCRRIC